MADNPTPIPVGVPSDAPPNAPNHKNVYNEVKQSKKRLDRLERGTIRSGSVGGKGLRFYDEELQTNSTGGTTARLGLFNDYYYDPSITSGSKWVPAEIRGLSLYQSDDDTPWFAAGSAGTVQTFNVGYAGSPVETILLNARYLKIESGISNSSWIELDTAGNLSLIKGSSSAVQFWNLTSIGAGDVLVLDGNDVKYVASALKYKQDIEDAEIDPEDVLLLRGRTWRDRNEVKSNPDTERRFVGFIADELAEVPSLRQFVRFNEEGEPETIYYDRLTVAVIELVKAHQTKINDQAAEIENLKTQVQELTDRLNSLQDMVESIL